MGMTQNNELDRNVGFPRNVVIYGFHTSLRDGELSLVWRTVTIAQISILGS